MLFATEKSWYEVLLIHVSFKNGEWDVSVGVVPLLIAFWIGAETVKVIKNWRLYHARRKSRAASS